MFEFQDIYKAYVDCKKGKSNTINVLKFEIYLIQNLCYLEKELKSRTYKIGSSICFLAHSPKLREVFAADFRDRVVHHLLINKIELFYEKKFIYDVYNNRKNKGIHGGVKRAQYFMRSLQKGYYMQLDIKGFFYHIDKNILFKKIFKDIKASNLSNKQDILYLANKIIYYDPTKNYFFKGDKRVLANLPSHKTLFKTDKNKGLPIGNLTSQFFVNVYMNSFDHFIKRELKIKKYIRYVDDFVLFDKDKKRLIKARVAIKEYLKNNLSLSLRDDGKIRDIKNGLNFFRLYNQKRLYFGKKKSSK